MTGRGTRTSERYLDELEVLLARMGRKARMEGALRREMERRRIGKGRAK